MTTPRWINAYATRSGMPDPRLVGTIARARHCATCGQLVIAGYDAPAIAGLAICDPGPLTTRLEAAAVICDIPTWRLWHTTTRWELTPRHVPGLPPECTRIPATRCTVLAGHRCGMPPLSTAHILGPVREMTITDEVPF